MICELNTCTTFYFFFLPTSEHGYLFQQFIIYQHLNKTALHYQISCHNQEVLDSILDSGTVSNLRCLT